MPTPQHQLGCNPSIRANDCVLWSAPSQAILVPKLCRRIQADVIKLAKPLSISLDKPSETSPEILLLSRSTLAIENGWQLEHAKTANDPSSATRPTGRHDCNCDAMAGFAAAHG